MDVEGEEESTFIRPTVMPVNTVDEGRTVFGMLASIQKQIREASFGVSSASVATTPDAITGAEDKGRNQIRNDVAQRVNALITPSHMNWFRSQLTIHNDDEFEETMEVISILYNSYNQATNGLMATLTNSPEMRRVLDIGGEFQQKSLLMNDTLEFQKMKDAMDQFGVYEEYRAALVGGMGHQITVQRFARLFEIIRLTAEFYFTQYTDAKEKYFSRLADLEMMEKGGINFVRDSITQMVKNTAGLKTDLTKHSEDVLVRVGNALTAMNQEFMKELASTKAVYESVSQKFQKGLMDEAKRLMDMTNKFEKALEGRVDVDVELKKYIENVNVLVASNTKRQTQIYNEWVRQVTEVMRSLKNSVLPELSAKLITEVTGIHESFPESRKKEAFNEAMSIFRKIDPNSQLVLTQTISQNPALLIRGKMPAKLGPGE